MLVCMKVEVSGTRAGRDWPKRGQTVELPDSEATALCQAGMAAPVAKDATETTTLDDDPEVRRTPRRTGRSRRTGAATEESSLGDVAE